MMVRQMPCAAGGDGAPEPIVRYRTERVFSGVDNDSTASTAGNVKGAVVKTAWVCMLLSLLSMVAYGEFSGVPGADGGEHALTEESAATVSGVAGSVPPGIYVVAGGLDAASGQTGRATRNSSRPAENFDRYVYWHKTRHEGIAATTAAGLRVCPE